MGIIVYRFTHLVLIIVLSSFLAVHAVESFSRKLCRGSSCQGRVVVTMAMHHCADVCVHTQTSVRGIGKSDCSYVVFLGAHVCCVCLVKSDSLSKKKKTNLFWMSFIYHTWRDVCMHTRIKLPKKSRNVFYFMYLCNFFLYAIMLWIYLSLACLQFQDFTIEVKRQ